MKFKKAVTTNTCSGGHLSKTASERRCHSKSKAFARTEVSNIPKIHVHSQRIAIYKLKLKAILAS